MTFSRALLFTGFCTLFTAGCGGVVDDGATVSEDSLKHKKCSSNADCGALDYCAVTGQCGGSGTCQPRGINLFCSNLYQPVCGCDGNTYANTCVEHKAGVNTASKGACKCGFTGANIDGDTLAEQPWTDASQTYFYTFTGNGTATNDSGTFLLEIEPPCLRAVPSCKIAILEETGTFSTSGTQLTLDYDNGNVATFSAAQDCHNTFRLVGTDFNQSLTLTVSPILP
jgi:hypothetical protein